MKVVVLGAGLAGMTAALELARRGCTVTILEAAAFAGGRTSSWRRSGTEYDTGLHVVADHYVNLIDLLQSVGSSGNLAWWNEHPYLHPGRAPLTMRFDPFPAPFHLWYAARNIPVSVAGRVRVSLAALKLAVATQAELAYLDDISYLEWHRRAKLGDGFLLELASVSADAAAFLSPGEASARVVLSWMKYLFRDARSARMATWRGTLDQDLVKPLLAALGRERVNLKISTAAVGLVIKDKAIRAVTVRRATEKGAFHRADGAPRTEGASTRIACDAVVSALPVQALRRILDPLQMESAGLSSIQLLRTVPATSATLSLDRRIPGPTGVPLVAGCSIRDFADLSLRHRDPSRPSVFQFVVSRTAGAETLNDDAIVDLLHRDLVRIWPAARGTRIMSATVARIGAALFAGVVGAHALRPAAATSIMGLYLAGDWTRHDLNASMEGAVVSGRLAARAVLGRRGENIEVKAIREASATRLFRQLCRERRFQADATP